MSAHAIATEMRASIRAYRRARRSGDQAVEHETKDTFCVALDRQLDALVRAIGTPALLSLSTGHRQIGTRSIPVVTRCRRPDRAPARLR